MLWPRREGWPATWTSLAWLGLGRRTKERQTHSHHRGGNLHTSPQISRRLECSATPSSSPCCSPTMEHHSKRLSSKTVHMAFIVLNLAPLEARHRYAGLLVRGCRAHPCIAQSTATPEKLSCMSPTGDAPIILQSKTLLMRVQPKPLPMLTTSIFLSPAPLFPPTFPSWLHAVTPRTFRVERTWSMKLSYKLQALWGGIKHKRRKKIGIR
jgi:hypothetical protein